MSALPHLPYLTLRAELALKRTNVANERTWLAYLRTGMALVVTGLLLIDFFRKQVFVWIGGFFVPFGLVMVALGWVRFRAKYWRINAALRARQAQSHVCFTGSGLTALGGLTGCCDNDFDLPSTGQTV